MSIATTHFLVKIIDLCFKGEFLTINEIIKGSSFAVDLYP